MSMLKRYVLVRFIQCYLLSLCALIGIFLIVDFFERADEFISRDLPLSDMAAYYLYKIPFITYYVAPHGVMLATVITLAYLARHNEFTAMKACGIGMMGVTLPIVGVSVVIALLVLGSSEFIAPKTTKKMNYIFFVKVRHKPTYGKIQEEKIWIKSKSGAIWNIDHFDPKSYGMTNVRVFFAGDNNYIRQRIDAARVLWDGRRWAFIDGYVRTFEGQNLEKIEYFQKRFFPFKEGPKDFLKVNTRADEMGLSELYRWIQTRGAEGRDTARQWMDLQNRISYPFISIVLALLAIPLSLRSSRRGGVLFCVGVNLAMGFCFSFIYAVGISLGRGNTFDPVLAAWGPIGLFTCLGFYLILTIDSERALPF